MTNNYLIDDNTILLELSLSNLRNNVSRNFGADRIRRSNRIKVANYQAIPSVGDRSILFKANIVGEEAKYIVSVRFTNVSFSNDPQPDYAEIKAMDGMTYHMKKVTASQTQAKVKCNCLDFYYRFSVWNHSKNSLEGDPPPPYVKKTDMPPVNPNRVPGACKHVIKMIDFLRGEQIIR